MNKISIIAILAFVWAGIIFSTSGQATAGDAPLKKPAAAKTSPEENKNETHLAKTNDPIRDEQIAKLIVELGDKDYYVRQRAQNELERRGFEAFDALTAATVNDDLEIASRAKYLLRLMRVEWTAKDDPPEVKILLKDYELQSEDGRLARIHALAVMSDGTGISALCRLIRFEKSELLSKAAVVQLLQSPSGPAPTKSSRSETIRKLFEKSSRPSAAWMLAWLKMADDPTEGLNQWNKIIEAELALLQRSSVDTSPEIVSGLIRYQISWLKKQRQTEQAMTAMRRLVDLEKGELDSLTELLDWLVEQKAWKVVDELAARFAPRFDAEPNLLYTLAEVQKEQGDDAKAEETAKRAFNLNSGKVDTNLFLHNMVARRLQHRGLFAWAKREYLYIIQESRPGDPLAFNRQLELAEMYHDQGEDQAAAELLETMLKTKSLKIQIGTDISGLKIANIRAMMYYFQACQWKTAGDQDKHRECLEKALELDPGDIEVLIACFRLPQQSAEYHNKIVVMIRKAADDLQVKIAAQPDNPDFYNQFAWLIGNTEGNLDEAWKCSQKSLELEPDNGGYYDTLARVCYAKGDYENAIKYQQRAIELEPHSRLIAKQLEFFRKAREEHKK